LMRARARQREGRGRRGSILVDAAFSSILNAEVRLVRSVKQ